MSWFGEPKDLIAIVIATLALIISVVTLFSQKWQQQRDAYREVYDVLMSPDLHQGRWMIVDIGEGTKKAPQRDSPEFLLIYRTLGVFSARNWSARRVVISLFRASRVGPRRA